MRGGEDAELGASDQIIEFAQNLAKKYPDDYKKCRALAEISGSGDYDDQVTMDDFDGADSVKKFLDRLEVEVSTP